jgi:virginiamycin A acetyltransferase
MSILKRAKFVNQTMIAKILYVFYHLKYSRLRRRILRWVLSLEGGEIYSITARKIFSKYHNVQVGMYTYGFISSSYGIPSGTIIGRYCSIPRNIQILSGNHPITFKSCHPFFFNPMLGFVDKLLITRNRLTIGNDVYIGERVTILPAVSEIGNGAVIGAGSVVTKNVPPFAVVAGNPARILKYRFSQATVDEITKSAWWLKDIYTLKDNEAEFRTFLNGLE